MRKRRRFRGVLRPHAAAMAILAIGLSSAREIDAAAVLRARAPIRMTVLGDSLALGTGAADPANAFAFRVYRSLLVRDPGSVVTNVAIGGSRVADVTRLQVPQVPASSDLVLVVVGGNDVVRRTATRRFALDYGRLLAAVRARAPRAAVVVCGVPDVARSPLFAEGFAKTEALARADDDAVRAEAHRYGVAFVDLFTLTRENGTNPTFFSNDDFHPSDAGYALFANATLPIVERALSASRGFVGKGSSVNATRRTPS